MLFPWAGARLSAPVNLRLAIPAFQPVIWPRGTTADPSRASTRGGGLISPNNMQPLTLIQLAAVLALAVLKPAVYLVCVAFGYYLGRKK